VIGGVVLGWGSELTIKRVPPAERIAMLAAQRSFKPDSPGLLELAARPMFTLTRPQTRGAICAAGRVLSEGLAVGEAHLNDVLVRG
jgi:hypothetical protein